MNVASAVPPAQGAVPSMIDFEGQVVIVTGADLRAAGDHESSEEGKPCRVQRWWW